MANQKTTHNEDFFETKDGLRLFYQEWIPESIKSLIVIIHGFGEHSGRYSIPASFLAKNEYSVHSVDNRGFGQSAGTRSHVYDYNEYIQDIQEYIQVVKKKYPNKKIYLLGHSQGGLIATKFCLDLKPESKPDGIILSSPFFEVAMKVPVTKVIAGKVVSKILPTFALPTGLNSSHLTHDAEIVKAYDTDPLVNRKATARWFTETTKVQAEIIERASEFQIPMLCLQAGSDKIVDKNVTRRFYDLVTHENKTWKSYEGFYHEIMNELEKERVYKDIVEWLDAH